MSTKKILFTISIAIIGGLIAVIAYSTLVGEKERLIPVETTQPIRFASLPEGVEIQSFDFTYAAEKTIHAVVHVKTQSQRERYYRNPLYDFFYGDRNREPEPVLGYGSGVIISQDGYIVTNNHVVENADAIEVVLNDRRSYKAELIGSDPSTDVAVIKVDEKDLMYVTYGNSEDLKVGEWVLAVGNPYNMTSTVTAGIVSAKARNLNLLDDRFPIESYIQTDAAVNRGNSGGALVNVKGELVGINSAIQSPTGAYAGNSFAIPVTIVRKIVDDIIEFGTVQRAILGITIEDITAEKAEELNLEKIEGVFVSDLRDNGAAREAGIEKGDVIVKINGKSVKQVSELQEQISTYRPNDNVEVTVIRNNKLKQFDVILRNMQGNTDIVKADEIISVLGAQFEELTDDDKSKYDIDEGLKIVYLDDGKLKEAGMKEGFIITTVEGRSVESVSDLQKIINGVRSGSVIEIEGIYPGRRYIYVYRISID